MGEAIKCFTVDAKQGHVDAQFNLGCLYASGNDVEQDNVMAYALWCLCADIDGEVADNLETLTENMSPTEIKKAKKLAETFID